MLAAALVAALLAGCNLDTMWARPPAPDPAVPADSPFGEVWNGQYVVAPGDTVAIETEGSEPIAVPTANWRVVSGVAASATFRTLWGPARRRRITMRTPPRPTASTRARPRGRPATSRATSSWNRRRATRNVSPAPSVVPISVIVRTKDRPALLREAIDSIRATRYPCEIVVVNDGGAPVEVTAQIEDIKLVHHEQSRGRAEAGNAGVRAASNSFIAFLADDDLFYAEHLSTLANASSSSHAAWYTDVVSVFLRPAESGAYETHSRLRLFAQDFDRELGDAALPGFPAVELFVRYAELHERVRRETAALVARVPIHELIRAIRVLRRDEAAQEECDDGDLTGGDGCSADCLSDETFEGGARHRSSR